MNDDLQLAEEIALACHRAAISGSRRRVRDCERAPSTEADHRAEEKAREILRRRRPDDLILGEEGGGHMEGDRAWVIDPIDGTINFERGLPGWSSAIALALRGEPSVSAVADRTGHVFSAVRGGGAKGPDGRLRVERRQLRLADAVLGTYISRNKFDGPLGASFGRLFATAPTIRARGAGTDDYLSVASGQLDGAVQARMKPWDRMPGELIVLEAGGAALNRGDWSIVARTAALAEEILETLEG